MLKMCFEALEPTLKSLEVKPQGHRLAHEVGSMTRQYHMHSCSPAWAHSSLIETRSKRVQSERGRSGKTYPGLGNRLYGFRIGVPL